MKSKAALVKASGAFRWRLQNAAHALVSVRHPFARRPRLYIGSRSTRHRSELAMVQSRSVRRTKQPPRREPRASVGGACSRLGGHVFEHPGVNAMNDRSAVHDRRHPRAPCPHRQPGVRAARTRAGCSGRES